MSAGTTAAKRWTLALVVMTTAALASGCLTSLCLAGGAACVSAVGAAGVCGAGPDDGDVPTGGAEVGP